MGDYLFNTHETLLGFQQRSGLLEKSLGGSQGSELPEEAARQLLASTIR